MFLRDRRCGLRLRLVGLVGRPGTSRRRPRGQRLDREREPLLVGVAGEHTALHGLAFLDDVTHAPHVAVRKFRHVHEPFHAWLELDERPELRDPAHHTLDRGAHVIFLGGLLPRALDEVAGREADLARLAIDFLDDHPHLLAGLQNVGRILHAVPGELAHVHETLDTVADVDERAKVAHAAHDAVERISHLERLEHRGTGVGRLPLDHRPPREHEPPRRRHDLGDEGLEGLADELFEVLDAPRAHEARRHEAAEPGHLAFEAALVRSRHAGLDDHPRFELRPVFNGHGPVGRGHVVEAILVIAAAHRQIEHVADIRHIVEPHELERPLPATTEIDEGRVVPNADHGAGHPGARIERSLGLGRHAAHEQVVDGHTLERRQKVFLEVILERAAKIRHCHPLRRRQNIGERRLPVAASAPLPPGLLVGVGLRVDGAVGCGSRWSGRSRSIGGRRLRGQHILVPRRDFRRCHAGPLRPDRYPPRRLLFPCCIICTGRCRVWRRTHSDLD